MAEMHKSITVERVMSLVEQAQTSCDNPGICLACGEDADGCEPDAENYECESCGARRVFGAERVLFMIA